MFDRDMTGNLYLFAGSETKADAADAPAAETSLVERIRAGDEEAFNELYRKYAPMVHGIILAQVGRDDAPDLVQEVFIAAFRNIDALREPAAVGAWLAMIARNRAREFFRRVKPTEELSEETCGAGGARTEAAEILSIIRRLPEAYRETLVLRLVEGMTGPEIAAQTGLKPDSVRVNLHRGMKILREKLTSSRSVTR